MSEQITPDEEVTEVGPDEPEGEEPAEEEDAGDEA